MDILPIELIPLILGQLPSPQDLYVTCRISRVFWRLSIPLLYERVYIQAWHQQSKQRMMQLFNTLSTREYLPTCIRTLEIRDYPKGLSINESARLIETCISAISRCVNLRSCVWTRDGSLSTPIIETLAACPQLEDLTINGHAEGHYDPHSLLGFSGLKRLTIIMPSASIVYILPLWMLGLGRTLQHFSLICKNSPLLSDQSLSQCCHSLSILSSLHLTGCTKITHHGIASVLRMTSLTSLGLAGLSPQFEISLLTRGRDACKLLQALSSVTLTVPKDQSLDCWWNDLASLLSSAPLQEFQIYTLGGDLNPHRQLPETFVEKLMGDHGSRLRKFAVQRLRTSLRLVNLICKGFSQLQQLFIVLHERDLEVLGNCFRQTTTIRALHISFPPDALSEIDQGRPAFSQEEMLFLATCLGPQLHSIGVSTRVYLIERILNKLDQTGPMQIRLMPYRSPEIPEQFLVVQT